MILTVTLNPAIDVTYRVASIVLGEAHRVSDVDTRAGGKGVNVANVLTQLGEPVTMTGLGGTGFPLMQDFFPIGGACRRTLVVTDGIDGTGFWEPGPQVTAAEWSGFLDHYTALLTWSEARVVVLSGSLPPGLPEVAYARLIDIAHAHGARSILDTSGAPLRLGLVAEPDLIKPNAREMGDVVGASRRTTIVASKGPDGLEATTADGVFVVRPPRPIAGNPTGAGDACVAALARGLRDGTAWPALLADAVALSAAAVAAPVAGTFDHDLYLQIRTEINP
ncbi:tagatose 6-phosphate kinase [Allocatelliglobosispora scoriae]|uniref:Tagatose 6-phosphate kinase n=1 Tax=Allocatelliglobosispora scoriae TaxID=643052 RepID=A0A841BSK2_9ACTN|nr:1-phosphofructokinase family hexose kinase [Allocatelliglobosispora scoriae]MBB5870685.1 tagatose 6-phosphate kinase [Allocatelliglobosispora scoriae]